MGEVQFVGYPRCSTSNKAQRWLDAHGIPYTFRHIVEDRPTEVELSAWIASSGLPFRRFFNTSGRLYRELGVKSKLDAGMNEAEVITLLASDGLLVKRPIVVGDGFVLVGFNEPNWEDVLL